MIGPWLRRPVFAKKHLSHAKPTLTGGRYTNAVSAFDSRARGTARFCVRRPSIMAPRPAAATDMGAASGFYHALLSDFRVETARLGGVG